MVAPSEVVAGDWRRRILLSGGLTALLEDRVVSWDRFKETAFGLQAHRRPVNRAFRQLFVLDLLRRHRDEALFERIVHPKLTDGLGSMAQPLLRLLPVLPRLSGPPGPEHPGATAIATDPDPAVRDLFRLQREYEGFLDAYGLFEPSRLVPSDAELTEDTVLYFPELPEDFSRFRQILEAKESLRVLPLRDFPPPATIKYRRFPTALSEFRQIAYELAGHLDAGLTPGDIAVTLGGWDQAFPYFAAECHLLDVPLAPRRGSPLSDYPSVRLFSLIQGVVDSDFELTRVEALLLDPSIPWKGNAPVAEIVRLGRSGRALGRFGPPGSNLDFWGDAFKRGGASSDLGRYAERLFRLLEEIRSAKDLAALRASVFRLLNGYLDSEAWPAETVPALERALELLGGLATAQAETGIELADSFSAWRTALSGTTYVPQASTVGIPVFDYRVGAGLLPDLHFVVNAHHAATRVTIDPLPGLRGDQKARLHLEPVSFSDDFLLSYALSGGSVSMSGAEEGITDRQMTPDWFSLDRIEDQEAEAPSGAPAFFAGAAIDSLSPLEWAGMLRYAETEGAPAPGSDIPEDRLGEILGDKIFSEEGTIRLSASRLRAYLSCPQGYLLSYLLDLEDDDPRVIPESVTALDEGNLMHEVLRRFNEDLREQDGAVETLSSVSESEVDIRLRDVIDGWGYRELPGPLTIARSLKYRLVPQLFGALRWEAASFGPGTPRMVEERLAASPFPGVDLRGTLDLGIEAASESEPGLAIVDYKRGNTPQVSSLDWTRLDPEEIAGLVGRGWNHEKMDIQLPVYLLLAQSNGTAVIRGQFYSLKAGAAGKAQFDVSRGHQADAVVSALEVLLRETTDRLRRGILGIPDEGRGCASCPFRGVCRSKFVAEERHD